MIKNFLLVIVSTLITLLFVEVVLRFYYADYLYTGSHARSLYYSYPNLTMTEDNRSVHYQPNTPIRSVTVYFNQVEYDTHHHANNFGFLSDENYTKEDKKGVVFLGDSFTAGVGSTTPYISQLNKKYKDINLYSFGVTGTGIWNFYNTFNTFKDKLNFDTVVIMSISDDLRRHPWYPDNQNNALYFCFDENIASHTCKHPQKTARLIALEQDTSALLKPDDIYIYKAYTVLKKKYNDRNKPKQEAHRSVLLTGLNYDMTYIKKIKSLADKLHKKVIFMHIPEKREALAGQYRCSVQKDMENLGIEYHPLLTEYHFDKSMYHKHDGHPNDKGICLFVFYH